MGNVDRDDSVISTKQRVGEWFEIKAAKWKQWRFGRKSVTRLNHRELVERQVSMTPAEKTVIGHQIEPNKKSAPASNLSRILSTSLATLSNDHVPEVCPRTADVWDRKEKWWNWTILFLIFVKHF